MMDESDKEIKIDIKKTTIDKKGKRGIIINYKGNKKIIKTLNI